MRRLAQELGIEAMSLYHHVRRKDDILAAWSTWSNRDPSCPTRRAIGRPIRQTAISEFEILSAHPWAASTILSVKQASEPRIRYMDWILGTLRQAGFWRTSPISATTRWRATSWASPCGWSA